ncbi:phosphoribosyltransferase family protein [Actinomadura sp. 6K520]|uniref:ComF family protein n=1 Tax=Actinomadura sp. 6K520 TaxID=2530364 RepID=UPI00104CA15E|nr:phosphoribosyltransferase family protein [Actinomadura sp. 6K520]TDE36106.1 ComF family protein [Actinomadura sp. 6K520]
MNLIADLLDLILPEHCAGCGAAPVLLCDACALPLQGPARPARTAFEGLPPPWTVTAYEGPLRAILAAYKEHGRTALAVPLGAALATAVQAALTPHHLSSPNTPGAHLGHDPPSLVWVPSRRGATRRRGHDTLRGLADVAAQRLRTAGVPVTPVDALRQRVRVADQAALTAAERTANLEGALDVTPHAELAGRTVVLVDDVVTTGASLTEAARALREAGADLLGTATIAATPRRRGSSKRGGARAGWFW